MQSSGAEMQAVGGVPKNNPPFAIIFSQVVDCVRARRISDRIFYNLIPKDVCAGYTYAIFKREYDDAVIGIFPDGAMSPRVAEGILYAIRSCNESQIPVRQAIEGTEKGDKKKEGKEKVDRRRRVAPPVISKSQWFPCGNDVDSPELSVEGETDVAVDAPQLEVQAEKPVKLESFWTPFREDCADSIESSAEEVSATKGKTESCTDEQFEIDLVRDYVSGVFETFGISPNDVFKDMPRCYRTSKNRLEVGGWFDGTVKQSPKALVAEFFEATVRVLSKELERPSQMGSLISVSEPHFA